MRYKIVETKNSCSWSYSKKNNSGERLNYECGYNNHKQEIYCNVYGENPHGTNYAEICSHSDFNKREINYKKIKKIIVQNFSRIIFSKIVKGIELERISAGRRADDREVPNSETSFESVDTILPKENSETNDPITLKALSSYLIKKDKYWSKSINTLQEFDFLAIRKAKLKSIPTFVKVIIYPFVFLMLLIGLFSIYDGIFSIRKMGFFLGLFILFLAYLIVFGIAAYWEKMNGRTSSQNYLIGGKTLINSIREYWGKNSIILPKVDEESMRRQYEKVISISSLSREHVFIDKNFKLGYSEGFVAITNTSKPVLKSVFIISIDFQLKDANLYGKDIQPWFRRFFEVEIDDFINTKGVLVTVKETFVVFQFSGVLYKAEDIFDVYMSLLLLMKKVDVGKWN